ncbi:MAG TPA: alpha/beta hydrolase [Solibacterales bacterium]|nr:alpha/beta hydrolase [Bryobacterales bacterium]
MSRPQSRLRRAIRAVLLVLLSVVLAAGALAGGLWLYLHPELERIDGIAYGTRHGKPLTIDILRPPEGKANGIGIAFMVSGGWKSKRAGEAPAWLIAPLIRAGYTVFAICHISQPASTVMEIVEDMNRGVRFVRHHARRYGVDPKRIGISGGSAGGHLSLMLATRGGPGLQDAPDPVDRESSAVQAVAIFYPVTDLLNLGPSTENLGDGGPPKSFVKAFGMNNRDLEVWKKIGYETSPIYYVGPHLPPTLIYHGDADTLVPLEQSQRFQERAGALGREVKLVVHPGGGHGWLTMVLDVRDFAAWFDRHLRPAPASTPR